MGLTLLAFGASACSHGVAGSNSSSSGAASSGGTSAGQTSNGTSAAGTTAGSSAGASSGSGGSSGASTGTTGAACAGVSGAYAVSLAGAGCGDAAALAECVSGAAGVFTLSAGGPDGLNGTFVLQPDGGIQNAAIQEGSAQRSGCVGSWDPDTESLSLDCGGVGTSQSCVATLTCAGEVCPGSSSSTTGSSGSTGSSTGTAGTGSSGGTTGGTGGADLPCDIAANAGTSCVVAYSMARPLFATYSGPLFKLRRDSDGATQDIGVVSGLADTAAASAFCQGTTCHVVTLYDQTSYRLDAVDTNANSDPPVPPGYLTMQAGGKTIPYWGNGYLEAGSRADGSLGNGAMPAGSVAVTEYEVVGPATGPGTCCTDFGEAEKNIDDTGKGHMFAVSLTPDSLCIDVENGGICGRLQGALPPLPGVVLAKTDGVSLFSMKAAGASDPLAVVSGSFGSSCGDISFYNQELSCFGYGPMSLEGGLTVGVGGDGSGDGTFTGSSVVDTAFIEGVVIAAQTSGATDDAIQKSINALFAP